MPYTTKTFLKRRFKKEKCWTSNRDSIRTVWQIKKMMTWETVDEDVMVVDYGGEQRVPEVIGKTYVVRALVDRRLKKTIFFHETVRRGIIDSGSFRDYLNLYLKYCVGLLATSLQNSVHDFILNAAY